MDVAVVLAALVAVIALGAVVGAVNAGLISFFQLSPFMVTLAMMSVLTGIVLFYTQGIPVYGVVESYITNVGRGQFRTLPIVLYVALGIVAICIVIQRFTPLWTAHLRGRQRRPLGAARACRPRRTLFTACLPSIRAAITGFLMISRIGSGQGTMGGTLALETIAAAAIGGVSLRGRRRPGRACGASQPSSSPSSPTR